MHQPHRARLASLAVLWALALAAGARAEAPPPPAAALGALVEAYWQEHLKLRPLQATFLGDHRYDAELPNNLSTAHLGLEYALEKRYLGKLAEIDDKRLAGQDLLTFAVFRRGRELDLEGYRYQAELLPVNQFGGLPQTFAQLGSGTSAQPFATVRDYENWLKRVDGFGVWVDQAIVNMRRGSARGYVQPRVVVERLLPQLERLIAADPAQSLFMKPVAEFPKGVPAAEQPRLRAAYLEAVSRKINPAYQRLRDFVRDEYLPRARATVAWTELPLGREWYAYRVKVATTTDLTPEQIHQVGLGEVQRIGAEMDRVIAELGFKGDRRAFLDALRADPRFYFDREEDLLAAYGALKAKVRARLPELFDLAPKADFEIRPVEAFRAAAQATASYQQPAADGSRPGIFYVNTYDLKSRPKYGMEEVYLHEAEPGHHFQIAIQQELPDLPSFRRFGGYGAYVEGWGLYAESLGRELGLYTDPYSYFGALSGEIWRAIRLVVDTGMHAKGWSRQQALDYLLANSAVGATDAAAEIDRYIAVPGQALTYKIGELKIKELKARAQRELGARYDVRAFHRAVLGDGALPLDVLDAKVSRWIATQKAAP
ncbi:MAG TPA: DUF885 domain-containing protein [Steroidobacteraceae bacterium]|nr:DUF885 domain-containing protein [Steroidobacteraceae bacterium]